MDQEYTPEQQQIRSNCLRWRRETIQLIKEEKWNLVQRNPCPSEECTICQNDVFGNSPLKPLFMYPEAFTYDIQAVIERIYGPQTPDQWYHMLLKHPLHLSTIQYFIENNLIDVNNGQYGYTIFSLYPRYYRRDTIAMWDYLLSEQVGFNINIQDCDGENALLTYLRDAYYDDDDEEERNEQYMLDHNEKIRYLLEKGSDPLLTDKNGISALEYAMTLTTWSQEQKDRLLSILQPYLS